MRLEIPREIERFGAVRLGSVQRVFELDSGLDNDQPRIEGSGIEQVPYRTLHEIQRQMAIVVPVRNERLRLIEGVLTGIPHPCLVIVVSNSERHPLEQFEMERDLVERFCRMAQKEAMVVHQKDPALADAFRHAGYDSVLDENGEVADGKAEGMISGILLARLAGRKYVGFIDGDNYFPGAVEEYIREYAAGFAMSKSKYSMVRISWHSKPKIADSRLFFPKWGRASADTNRLLNAMIGYYTGYETEVIRTGNSGEHAITMDLALSLDYSAGYSIEPYQLVNLIERFGGLAPSPVPDAMQHLVEVHQIESRNPHLHEAGDDEHVADMISVAMQVIYHSPVCPPNLKEQILGEMRQRQLLLNGNEPPRPRHFPPLSSINLDRFLERLVPTPYGKLLNGGARRALAEA